MTQHAGLSPPHRFERASTGFRVLALLTALFTLLEIVLGGTVRATGSGEACPDWPTCHGQVVPPFTPNVLIEYSHRLTASLVSILVIALAVAAIWIWRQPRYLRVLCGVAVLLLIAQVLLGGLTVLTKLPPQVVAAHLATATALLGVLTAVSVYAFSGRGGQLSAEKRRFSRAAMLAASMTFLLILTGSYVVGSDAGLACHTWPLCNGAFVPMGGLAAVDVNFLHRLVALLVGISLIALVLIGAQSRQTLPGLVALSVAAMFVYLAQVLIGAANVWLSLAASVRIAHLATAQMLWVITIAVAVVAAAGERRTTATSGEAVARRRLPVAATGNRRPRFGDRVRASAGDSDRGGS